MVEIQALRLEKGEEPNDVHKWSLEIEKQVAEYEEITQGVRKTVKNLREEASREAKLEDEKVEEEKRKQPHEEGLKLEEAKMQIKRDFEKNMGEEQNKSVKESGAKLPKLTVTKFQGTHLDWLWFWSQFKTEIDEATITQVAKFLYLKELLVPKVRSAVDGLPYNTEGYERTKAILRAKYGKPSEVVNAHIQSIIALPTVQGSQQARVHNFYKKLATNVQALEMIRKIKEINGYVWVTLGKLPGVRADLVRLDDNWHMIGRSHRCWRHFVNGVTGILYTHPTNQTSRETDSSTQGKKIIDRDCAFTALQPATSLLTVTR